jgi:hypothetical protein
VYVGAGVVGEADHVRTEAEVEAGVWGAERVRFEHRDALGAGRRWYRE